MLQRVAISPDGTLLTGVATIAEDVVPGGSSWSPDSDEVVWLRDDGDGTSMS